MSANHPALTLFTELLVAAPSGREEWVAEIVRRKLEEWGYDCETDPAGNVLVRLAGSNPNAPTICYAAHMDEIGMVVTAIDENGDLRVDRSGGLYPWKMGEGPVEIIGDIVDADGPVIGVLSMGSTHGGVGDKAIEWKDVRVITGLSPAQLKDQGVRVGSTAVPIAAERGPVLFGPADDPLVAAWTFDDRMGVVALLRLLERLKWDGSQPVHPTLVAFTVHEEGGGQGAKIVADRERPDIFIAVDGCPIPPGTPLKLDGRPGIWSKDRLTHYDQRLVRSLMEAAERAGSELQPVVYDGAASDASLVAYAGGAYRVACFGHVRENSHGYEVARLSVFDAMLETLVAFVGMEV
ncbi:MAG: M20/M25/M40 family metallo-hydrolase [Caldilineaceae bacterium]|nr:M20/M25/M40 family metallo-hydrolase [Caldilineaceae bacterium]